MTIQCLATDYLASRQSWCSHAASKEGASRSCALAVCVSLSLKQEPANSPTLVQFGRPARGILCRRHKQSAWCLRCLIANAKGVRKSRKETCGERLRQAQEALRHAGQCNVARWLSGISCFSGIVAHTRWFAHCSKRGNSWASWCLLSVHRIGVSFFSQYRNHVYKQP